MLSDVRILGELYRLRRNQWLEPSKLAQIQQNKLRALIKYAYENVPYYERLFNSAGIKPNSIRSRDNLKKIPITSREDIQKMSISEIVARGINIKSCLSMRTSGSAGRPLDIFLNKRELFRLNGLPFLLMYFENGGRLRDKTFRITTPNFIRKKKLWFQHFGILEEYFVSVYDNPKYILTQFINIKPHILRGYTSGIKTLALEMRKKGITINYPKLIFCTAELLSQNDRSFITSVFGAKVIDHYCCNECGIIAWECREHSGYHINSENVIVEIVKEGKAALPEEEGEIVITNLDSYTMPFIRYKIGDIGIISNDLCPCGRKLPLLKVVSGRVNDQVIRPDGTLISPYLTIQLAIGKITGIRKFQIVQKRRDLIIVKIVKDEDFSSNNITRIKENFRGVLGDRVEVELNMVDEIPISRSGKYKVIISEVSQS